MPQTIAETHNKPRKICGIKDRKGNIVLPLLGVIPKLVFIPSIAEVAAFIKTGKETALNISTVKMPETP
jgi:hypothetical protein